MKTNHSFPKKTGIFIIERCFFKHISKSLKFSKSEKVKSLTTITNKIYPQKSTRKRRAFEKYHLLKSPT
jgi:hypothetical protein